MIDKRIILLIFLITLYIGIIIIFDNLGIDFSVYYTSGRIALEGNAERAYEPAYHHQMNELYLNKEIPFKLGWYYPPIFFLMVIPFSLLPLKISYILWLIVTFLLYVYTLRYFSKKYFVMLLFPGILMTILWGQNGFLIVFLMGMLTKYMDEPKKAGVILALMCFKPHFAILFVLMMFLKREWKLLFYTMISLTALFIVSSIMFGVDIWWTYLKVQLSSGSVLIGENFSITNAIQPSVFSALKILNVPVKFAYSIQILVMLGVVSTIFIKWNDATNAKRSAMMVLGTFLINPYFLQYDLVLLIIPILFYIESRNLNIYEQISIGITWSLPLLSLILVQMIHVQITPLVIINLFVLTAIKESLTLKS